jgi:pimeloyl-ACP methyl ester carboxylesterase
VAHQQDENLRALMSEGEQARPRFEAMRDDLLRPSAGELEEAFTQLFPPRHRAEAREFAEHRFASLRSGLAEGDEGLFEDASALVHDWGFSLATVAADVRYSHGRLDTIVSIEHGEWFVDHLPSAEVVLTDDDDHLSMLLGGTAADFGWLAHHLA